MRFAKFNPMVQKHQTNTNALHHTLVLPESFSVDVVVYFGRRSGAEPGLMARNSCSKAQLYFLGVFFSEPATGCMYCLVPPLSTETQKVNIASAEGLLVASWCITLLCLLELFFSSFSLF